MNAAGASGIRGLRDSSGGLHARIRAVVSRIPRGRVATYGQIARLAGAPGQARLVGYALASLPEGSALPWHRVVNARGQVSERSDGSPMAAVQRARLRGEGVRTDGRGRISLERLQWRPRVRAGVAPTRTF